MLLSDSLIPDKMNLVAQIRMQQSDFKIIQFNNQQIAVRELLLDTVFSFTGQLSNFQINIKKIEFTFDTLAIQRFENQLQRINKYYASDSLFSELNNHINILDNNNIDMIPIYQFELADIKKELIQHDKYQYELMLARSGLDNGWYLHKRDILWQKIEEKEMLFAKKMEKIDELMYEKARKAQKEGHIQTAIHYYNRCLDFNPEHCQAIGRLTSLYIENKMYQENLKLFQGLRSSSQITICKAEVVDNVCDSLCIIAKEYIFKHNYYSALKILDTVNMFLENAPPSTLYQTYTSLCHQAQHGIYNSYFGVINKAIDNHKMILAKEYLLSLATIMREDENNPCTYADYTKIMHRITAQYLQQARQNLRRKSFEKALVENIEMCSFLDSIDCPYDQPAYFDIYIACYTAIYNEKINKQDLSAEQYYQEHRQYIQLDETTRETDKYMPSASDFIVIVDSIFIYGTLYHFIRQEDVSPRHAQLLDTFMIMRLHKPYIIDTTIFRENNMIIGRLENLIINNLSDVNRYLWGNEFNKAKPLLKKIREVTALYQLDTNSQIMKSIQTSEQLWQERFTLNENMEFHYFTQKLQTLVKQKKYNDAHQYINQVKALFSQSKYQKNLDDSAQKYHSAAIFEQKYTEAVTMLAIGNFTHGMDLYDSAYRYFVSNQLDTLGLSCDNLFDYACQSHRCELLTAVSLYFADKQDYDNALKLMQISVQNNLHCQELQKKLGINMQYHQINVKNILSKYTFKKVHKLFLQHYIGKLRTWFYLLRTVKK